MGFISQLILTLSAHSQLLAHQLLWDMRANMYTDEEAKVQDVILYKPLKDIVDRVSKAMMIICPNLTISDHRPIRRRNPGIL